MGGGVKIAAAFSFKPVLSRFAEWDDDDVWFHGANGGDDIGSGLGLPVSRADKKYLRSPLRFPFGDCLGQFDLLVERRQLPELPFGQPFEEVDRKAVHPVVTRVLRRLADVIFNASEEIAFVVFIDQILQNRSKSSPSNLSDSIPANEE